MRLILASAVLALFLTVANGARLLVEHALIVGDQQPVYTTRGVLTYGDDSAAFEQVPLSSPDAAALRRLVEEDGLYFIRVGAEASGKERHVSTLVRACTLVSSKLKDSLAIHFGDGGEVVGLEYAPSNRTCANKLFLKKIQEGSTFKTTVKMQTKGLAGPSPVIDAKVVEEQTAHVEYDKDGKPIPKQPQQEPGFFQKYWMYIIPGLVIFNALGAANSPQQQQQQGGAQGGGAQGAGGGERK